ncbi:MAG: hypothetical protein GY774_15980 [Planctomycetes bacterium]|nr:hypothetical protein [Planctomycetota bacterium]
MKLRSEGIKSVDWGPGQGNIAGKDNDWKVALWFDVDSIVFDGERSSRWIYIVGPSGDKAGREEFGSRFIEFLQANRVNLTLPSAKLLGEPADVVQDLNPLGKVRVGTDEYVAHYVAGTARGIIKKGSSIVIEEIRGTSVYARKTNGPNKAIQETP